MKKFITIIKIIFSIICLLGAILLFLKDIFIPALVPLSLSIAILCLILAEL